MKQGNISYNIYGLLSSLLLASFTCAKFLNIVVRKGDSLIIENALLSMQTAQMPSLSSAARKNHWHLGRIEDGTVSIQNNLTFSFKTCYLAETRTNLVILSYSHNEFLGIIENIATEATRLKTQRIFRHSFCEIFILIEENQKQNTHQEINYFRNENWEGQLRNASMFVDKDFPFNLLSDLYVIFYHESASQAIFKFWEIYTVKRQLFVSYVNEQKQILQKQLGMFSVTLNLTAFLMYNITKFTRRQNMQGLHITASVFLNEGDENDNEFELSVGTDENGQPKLISGLSVSILHDFQAVMNFTEKVLKIYFGLENYFSTAFLSDDYPFDINLFHTSVTKNKTDVGQPLHPTFFDGVHAIFVQPTDQDIQNIFGKPFASQVWYLLFLTWAFIFFSCKLIMRIKTRFNSSKPKLASNNEDYSYYLQMMEYPTAKGESPDKNNAEFETGLWCICAVCQKGWSKIPTALSIRIIVFSSLILSVVCYAAFTGKIVSELWNTPKPISSLKSLLSYAKRVYLVAASDASQDILEGIEKRAPDVLDKIRFRSIDHIYKKLVSTPGRACVITWPDSVTSYVQELFQMKNAMQKDGVDAYICDTFTSFTYQSYSSLFIPKNSELESLFNIRIIVGLERGFVRRYWNAYKGHSFLSCLDDPLKVTTLDFIHVYFAFLIMGLGLLSSFALLVLEWILIRFRRGSTSGSNM